MAGIALTPAGPVALFGGITGAPTKQQAPRGNGCRDWVQATRQASFKGVAFEVAEDTRSGGRRLAIHVYPARETYDVEDLGREVQAYSVSAYVIGDAADIQCDLLYAMCNEPEPALLVLPLGFPVQAFLLRVQSNHVYDEMGRIPVQLEFIEYVQPRGGLFSFAFLQDIIRQRANEASGRINDAFSVAFDTVMRGFSAIDFVPSVARVAAADEINRVREALDKARQGVHIAKHKEGAAIEYAVRQMRRRARFLAYRGQRPNRYDLDTFIADQTIIKSGLSSMVSESVRRIAEFGETPEAAYSSLYETAQYQAEPIERAQAGTARSERAEVVLSQEVGSLFRRHSLIRLADVATKRRYKTRQDAIRVKSQLAMAFESELRGIEDVNVFEPLQSVLDATADFLTQREEQSPNLTTLRGPPAMPAVVAAWDLYKDARKAGDIIEQNDTRIHPLFLPAEFRAPLALGVPEPVREG